jgi:hypothetical protein
MTLNAKPCFLWDNLLARAGALLSATNSASSHPVQNLADWREYLTWKSADNSGQDLKIDCGSSQSASACVIYGHNLFSAGRSLAALYGSQDNSTWTQIFQQTIGSDDVMFKTFSSVNYRYYKLTISSGSLPAEIALFFIGDFLEFPSWPAAGFDPNQKETVVEYSKGEQGHLLGSVIKYSSRKIVLALDHLADDFVRNSLLPFWNAHIPRPFLFAWDRSNHGQETYLVEVSDPKLDLPYQPVTRSLKLELEGRAS